MVNEMQNLSTEKTRLTSIVADAIKFLAPYFEVDLNKKKLELPEVLIGDPEYDPNHRIIYLQPFHPRVPRTRTYYFIGHEIGHWLHHLVNPDLYLGDRKYNLTLDCLREAVARWSGIICVMGEGWVQNKRYTLAELTRMNLERAEYEFDYIYSLCRKLAF